MEAKYEILYKTNSKLSYKSICNINKVLSNIMDDIIYKLYNIEHCNVWDEKDLLEVLNHISLLEPYYLPNSDTLYLKYNSYVDVSLHSDIKILIRNLKIDYLLQ